MEKRCNFINIKTTQKPPTSQPELRSESSDDTFSMQNPAFKATRSETRPTLDPSSSIESGFETANPASSESAFSEKSNTSDRIQEAATTSEKTPAEALFKDVKPLQKSTFTHEVEVTTSNILRQLDSTRMNPEKLREFGPLSLKVLGFDAETINPELLTSKNPKKNPISQVALKVRELQLSLQNAQKYEDLTQAGLKKIEIAGPFSDIAKPADLGTINDVLAKLSLPQITPEFSDKNSWFSSSGSSKVKTITFQANKIITQLSDIADKYLRTLLK